MGQKIDIAANVRAVIMDKDGRILEIRKAKNLVVNSGLQALRNLIGGTGFRPDELQVGTGTTATTADMVELENSVITKTIDRRVRQTYGIELQGLLDLTEANGYTISEIATFEQSTMIARAILSPAINKTASIQVTLGHLFTLSAS